MSQIGERINKIRKENKMTLTQVAGDQMSAAMVSLVENGKTKPTVQTLEHIASQLGVEPTELMGEMSRSELREIVDEVQGLFSYDSNALKKMIKKLEETLPYTTNNYESARIHDLYARSLFNFYQFFSEQDNLVKFREWEGPAQKAKQIYKYLQFDSRSLKMDLFFVEVEYSNANYAKVLDMIEDITKELNQYEQTLDIITIVSNLYLMKVHAGLGLGMWKEAYRWLDEAILYCKQNMVFQVYYALQNTAVLLNYNEGKDQQAQYHLNEIDQFISLIDNDQIYLEKRLIQPHYEEFFKNNFEEAFEICEELEEEIDGFENLSDELRKGYQEHINEMKARCYTKMKEPNKALSLFSDEFSSMFINDHPLDRSLRQITYSYRAYCYQQLRELDQAKEEAEKAVESLRTYPHTEYYQFARNVLKEVHQSK